MRERLEADAVDRLLAVVRDYGPVFGFEGVPKGGRLQLEQVLGGLQYVTILEPMVTDQEPVLFGVHSLNGDDRVATALAVGRPVDVFGASPWVAEQCSRAVGQLRPRKIYWEFPEISRELTDLVCEAGFQVEARMPSRRYDGVLGFCDVIVAALWPDDQLC
jgi:hypothetical protein